MFSIKGSNICSITNKKCEERRICEKCGKYKIFVETNIPSVKENLKKMIDNSCFEDIIIELNKIIKIYDDNVWRRS